MRLEEIRQLARDGKLVPLPPVPLLPPALSPYAKIERHPNTWLVGPFIEAPRRTPDVSVAEVGYRLRHETDAWYITNCLPYEYAIEELGFHTQAKVGMIENPIGRGRTWIDMKTLKIFDSHDEWLKWDLLFFVLSLSRLSRSQFESRARCARRR